MGNLNIFELLIVAALAYAAYRAFQAKDTTAAICLAAPALYLLTSAFGSTDEFGGPDPAPGVFALGNIAVMELLIVGVAAYGSFRMINIDRTAAIIGFAASAYLLYNASMGTDEL